MEVVAVSGALVRDRVTPVKAGLTTAFVVHECSIQGPHCLS
jgi:hypothetical protein